MRHLPLTRDEAELLVDLLEAGPEPSNQRLDLSDEIRVLFGMCTREESDQIKRSNETSPNSRNL